MQFNNPGTNYEGLWRWSSGWHVWRMKEREVSGLNLALDHQLFLRTCCFNLLGVITLRIKIGKMELSHTAGANNSFKQAKFRDNKGMLEQV